MGKLSDLIKFRNELTNFVEKLNSNTDMAILLAESLLLAETSVSTAEQLVGVNLRYKEYIDQYQGIIAAYKKVITNTKNAIDLAGDELINATPLLSEDQIDILTATYPGLDQLPDKVRSTIHEYSNTRYPGLIISPCNENLIRLLTASDPLYLVCRHLDYLDSKIENFPEQYQNRLGLYDNIENLPANQFSIIVVSDLFRHLPYPQVIKYLQTIIQLLRPGGCLIFAFNNCDIFEIAVHTELGHTTFSSQFKLEKDCVATGYEILNFDNSFIDLPNYKFISWAMIKKPGKLTTVKQTQAQGLVGRK